MDNVKGAKIRKDSGGFGGDKASQGPFVLLLIKYGLVVKCEISLIPVYQAMAPSGRYSDILIYRDHLLRKKKYKEPVYCT